MRLSESKQQKEEGIDSNFKPEAQDPAFTYIKNYLMKTAILSEAHLQTSTAAESSLKRRLIELLRNLEFKGELAQNEFLILSTSATRKILRLNNRPIPNSYKNKKFIIRRPDFFIPGLNIVIEVDGPVHDKETRKITSDSNSDYEYQAHGISVFRIQNRDLSSDKIGRPLTKLKNLIKDRMSSDFCSSNTRSYLSKIKSSFLDLICKPEFFANLSSDEYTALEQFKKCFQNLNRPQDRQPDLHGYPNRLRQNGGFRSFFLQMKNTSLKK